MQIYPFLLDSLPAYAAARGAGSALLLMPSGPSRLVAPLRRELERVTHEAVRVVTTFEPEPTYVAALQQSAGAPLEARPLTAIGGWLRDWEPSDRVLLVDPRFRPTGGLPLAALLRNAESCPLARCGLVLRATPDGIREAAHLDDAGQIDRIQRYFDGVTMVDTLGAYALLVPVSALRLVAGLAVRNLAELRAALAVRGVPSQDLPSTAGAHDLDSEGGLLLVNELALLDATADEEDGRPLVGRGCRVSASARLVGPVCLQDGVTIEDDALLVGPTVCGAGSRIERGAVVAQCVLAPGARVPAAARVRHRVIAGEWHDHDGRLPSSGLTAPLAPCAVSYATGNEDGPAAGPRRGSVRLKRLIDFALALLGLIVIAPLLAVAAILIKATSRGPVLFSHAREGRDGRVFRCWKFRTMVDNAQAQQRKLYQASEVDGPQFKIDRDPRVTPIGRLLRTTNIDELPQLINVLRGDMSLIGPRPSPFRENQICVPWRQARLSVRPGITGLWQICRHDRGTGDFHQWIYYDVLYVRHMSLWLDIKIFVATLLTLGGRYSVPLRWMLPRGGRRYGAGSAAVTGDWVTALHERLEREVVEHAPAVAAAAE